MSPPLKESETTFSMRSTRTSTPNRSRTATITGCASGHQGSSTSKGGKEPRVAPVLSHRTTDTWRPPAMASDPSAPPDGFASRADWESISCPLKPRWKEHVMAGTKTEAKGKKNKVVGGVKKETGRVTKNRSLEAKGATQKAKGSVEETAGKAARRWTS